METKKDSRYANEGISIIDGSPVLKTVESRFFCGSQLFCESEYTRRSNLSRHFNPLPVRVSTFSVRVSTLSVRVSTLSVRVSTLSVRVSTLSVRVSTLSVRVSTLRETQNKLDFILCLLSHLLIAQFFCMHV